MKKIFITLALVSATLFTYAEKEETKENKVKLVIENFIKQEEVNIKTVATKAEEKPLLDIRPFIKPEREVEEDIF